MNRRDFIYTLSSAALSSCLPTSTVIPPAHNHYTYQAALEQKQAEPALEYIIESSSSGKVKVEIPQQKSDFTTPEYRALLNTIAWAEGTDCHYNMMVGRMLFKDYSSHPVETGEMPKEGFPFKQRGRRYWFINHSTAAGRYQFLYRTYTLLKEKGLFQTGFNAEEQDKAALYLITLSGITQETLEQAIKSKDFIDIWHELSDEWASLPDKKTKRSKHRQFAYKEDNLEKIFFYFYETSSAK